MLFVLSLPSSVDLLISKYGLSSAASASGENLLEKHICNPQPKLTELEIPGKGKTICVLNSPSGDSSATKVWGSKSVRITDLEKHTF